MERQWSIASRQSAAYTAAKGNDQKSLEILRDFWREEMVAPINNRGDSILHFLAIGGNVDALRLLIEERLMSSEDLKIKNKNGDTPLHEAARFGRKGVLELILSSGGDLVLMRNNLGETPVYVAAASGEKEVFILLAQQNFSEFTVTRDDGSTVLHAAVTQESYCNAWLGEIDDAKQKHILALKLAQRLIEEEDWSYYADSVTNPLIQATKLGIDELVVEIIQKYPQAAETLDEDGKNILHIAAERKNRFLFDQFLKKVAHKDRMLADIDQQGKTVMHFAASVESPYRFSIGEPSEMTGGIKAVLLMMWGVLWFKRVKYCVHPRLWSLKNSEGLTAKELFERNHSGIRKEAEKTIRDLGNSVLILATLLSTINFAAVFTVPGGFDDKTGLPILLNTDGTKSELWMLMFFLAAALFDSVFTMGALLSFLLSKFDSDDFYIAIPLKICGVYTFVYYSAAFTVLAGIQALNLENIFMNRDVWWLSFFILCLAFLVALIFVDMSYLVFDYMYHFLRYSLSYKRQYM
ncbi:ankyrin repeat-containing protein ITN1-like isoform X2 [Lycium ferocissimum]|uniref:ankyrin repeat-containing protein ITN1-like isoform X2 n=1 Tax=Lycium ferocissimum TaxID=112874 RepID=UPI0028153709|nr:ankyrin repeat-containing protein ITN1-like isoform X2 [Lycium ferocissimum]